MRIALTGSTGMIGSALVPYLTGKGHEVTRLLHRAAPTVPGITDLPWSDATALPPLDAVIHLAGANVAGQRWSASYRRTLIESRTLPTARLARQIAASKNPPATLICASGAGYYGTAETPAFEENSPRGFGFLAELCEAWEDAARPASDAGVRTVFLRLGMVLSPSGGALAKMLGPFRAGLGGPVGDGRQWVSWISLRDALALFLHALQTPSLSGPVNATSPDPVRNANFATALGTALGRPAKLRAPAFALRLAFGEMADELLLKGARVQPAKALASGFTFQDPTLAPCLQGLLKSI